MRAQIFVHDLCKMSAKWPLVTRLSGLGHLAEIANVPVTPVLRNRNGIAQLRCIDSDESPAMLIHNSPALFEALPG